MSTRCRKLLMPSGPRPSLSNSGIVLGLTNIAGEEHRKPAVCASSTYEHIEQRASEILADFRAPL